MRGAIPPALFGSPKGSVVSGMQMITMSNGGTMTRLSRRRPAGATSYRSGVRHETSRGPRAAADGEIESLVLENQRLQDENEALRASAELWIRMYEAQLERAQRLAGDRGPSAAAARHAN